jgi:LacI family transcriptional regulator
MTNDRTTLKAPQVLVALYAHAAWSRGILRGFMATAQERAWTLLHYHPSTSLNWLASEWSPAAAVFGPELGVESLAKLAPASLISVTVDRSAAGIASVCLDEEHIAQLALEHFASQGFRQVSTFRFDESPFAVARERAFVARAGAAGIRVAAGWGNVVDGPPRRGEDPAVMVAWLRALPKPCGIFTCTDGWGRTVARYAHAAGLRVPEDLALVGADNDVLECELMAPPLSSVMIPWREVGRSAAGLVQRALAGQSIAGERVVVSPTGVMARRSSDTLAIDDELVASAVRWIRENADRRLTVPMVARAVGGGRQRLERRFRAVLDRTVQEEVRLAHVEAAKKLLSTTRARLSEVAKKSGFTNAALLNAAFQREVGMPPGLYRRRTLREFETDD